MVCYILYLGMEVDLTQRCSMTLLATTARDDRSRRSLIATESGETVRAQRNASAARAVKSFTSYS
jgi:hypothetical protein